MHVQLRKIRIYFQMTSNKAKKTYHSHEMLFFEARKNNEKETAKLKLSLNLSIFLITRTTERLIRPLLI
jgi:hypothetical protein